MNVAIFNDTRSHHGHIGCNIVMSNLELLLNQRGISTTFTWPSGNDWRNHKKEIKRILQDQKIKAIIVNGEGTLHHSEDRPHAHALAELAVFARQEIGCNAYLVNATLHKNSEIFYKKINYFNFIFVRDRSSLKELMSHGLIGEVVPDLTLISPKNKGDNDVESKVQQKECKSARNGIAVTDSVFRDISKTLLLLSREKKWEYQQMAKSSNLNIRDLYRPRTTISNLIKLMHDIKYTKYTKEPLSFLDWLSSKELIITGRYHTVTLCLLTRTPFLAIESNTPKISSLSTDVFGNAKRVIDGLDNVNESTINKAKVFDDMESRYLEEYLISTQRGAESMIAAIKAGR